MPDFQVLEGGNQDPSPREDDHAGQEQIVALRMPRRLVAALDVQVTRMNDEYPGVRVTRSSIVRFAIHNFIKQATDAAGSREATRKLLGG